MWRDVDRMKAYMRSHPVIVEYIQTSLIVSTLLFLVTYIFEGMPFTLIDIIIILVLGSITTLFSLLGRDAIQRIDKWIKERDNG
jgi:hypothetical protein